jgi:hypothetical protein
MLPASKLPKYLNSYQIVHILRDHYVINKVTRLITYNNLVIK